MTRGLSKSGKDPRLFPEGLERCLATPADSAPVGCSQMKVSMR